MGEAMPFKRTTLAIWVGVLMCMLIRCRGSIPPSAFPRKAHFAGNAQMLRPVDAIRGGSNRDEKADEFVFAKGGEFHNILGEILAGSAGSRGGEVVGGVDVVTSRGIKEGRGEGRGGEEEKKRR